MHYKNYHATTLLIAAENENFWVCLIILYYFNLKPPQMNAVNSTIESLRSKLDGNKRIRIIRKTSPAVTAVTHVVIESIIITPMIIMKKLE